MLLVGHPDGKSTDGRGRRCFEEEHVYFSGAELPAKYEGATFFVIDEDVAPTEGAFGDYELGKARGHHSGTRIWVEAPTFDEARKLYMLMGDRNWARRYQARKAGRPPVQGTGSDRRQGSGRAATPAPAQVTVRAADSGAASAQRVEVVVTGTLTLVPGQPVAHGTIAVPVSALGPAVGTNGNGGGTNGDVVKAIAAVAAAPRATPAPPASSTPATPTPATAVPTPPPTRDKSGRGGSGRRGRGRRDRRGTGAVPAGNRTVWSSQS
jgi:hypothetical protein